MTDEQKKNIGYRIKDWVTIISALAPFIGAIWLWVNVFSGVPKRIENLEQKSSQMHDSMLIVQNNVEHITQTVDRISRQL